MEVATEILSGNAALVSSRAEAPAAARL